MSEIQADWLTRTRATLDRLHSDLATVDVDELGDLLQRAAITIDPPPDHLHAAILSLMLLEVCLQTVQYLHEARSRVHCTCHEAGWSRTGALTRLTDGDPRSLFREWTQDFLAHLEREHPRTIATVAAALMRSDPTKVWTLNELSRAIDTRPDRLRQEFRTRFGLRPSTYLHLVRTARAVVLLGTPTKVEAIAWEVGYRSKKDLYAALKRWVGATPTELRALSHEERDWLERQLRVRCVGRTFGACESDTRGGFSRSDKSSKRRALS